MLHVLNLFFVFIVSGGIRGKNPVTILKNQIPAYLAAIGTQSSAACIPVNIQCSENNGVSREIRNFVIPLCANIHMTGSMITITCCVTSLLIALYITQDSFGTACNVCGDGGIALMVDTFYQKFIKKQTLGN